MPRRNAKGSGSIRQRPSGIWEGRYSNGYHPITGKQNQKSIYGKTKAEVSKKLRLITSQIDKGTYSEPCHTLLSEWLETWMQEYCNGIKHSSVVSYQSLIRLYINPNIGHIQLSKLTPITVQKMYNTIYKGNDEEGIDGKSAKTIKNIHGVLHKALDQAVKLNYIPDNCTDKCDLPKLKKPEITPLENDEIIKLLSTIDNAEEFYIIHFALFTGIRIAEQLALTWEDIDFENDTIIISKQLAKPRKKDDPYIVSSTKNDKKRHIQPSRTVMDMLFIMREKQQDYGIFSPYEDFGNLVFCKVDGSNHSHGSLYKILQRNLKKAGLRTRRYHDLRHTYAVNALLAGDDPKTVSENLGHATVAFTLDTYDHVTKDRRNISAKKMDKFIADSGLSPQMFTHKGYLKGYLEQ